MGQRTWQNAARIAHLERFRTDIRLLPILDGLAELQTVLENNHAKRRISGHLFCGAENQPPSKLVWASVCGAFIQLIQSYENHEKFIDIHCRSDTLYTQCWVYLAMA